MVKPGFFDSKYDGLSSNERMRQYERDKMIYEQTEAINESNRLAELRIEQENRNAEMLREQQERNMEIMQERYEEEQARQEVERQEQQSREKFNKLADKLDLDLEYEELCEFNNKLNMLTVSQFNDLKEAVIEYNKIFYTKEILDDLKKDEKLKDELMAIDREMNIPSYLKPIIVKRNEYLHWRIKWY